ncbi:MAG: hypothetical protein RIS97_1257 [Pseudomonadota bacterium]|jgi:hypothetical protein
MVLYGKSLTKKQHLIFARKIRVVRYRMKSVETTNELNVKTDWRDHQPLCA